MSIKPDADFEAWLKSQPDYEPPQKPNQGRPSRKPASLDDDIERLVCEGCSNQEIAEELGITIAVVKNHFYVLMGKYGTKTRGEFIATRAGKCSAHGERPSMAGNLQTPSRVINTTRIDS